MTERLIFSAILAFSTCLCHADQAPGLKQTKVLYIGNSLTYTNDLPGIVEEIGKKDGMNISSTSYCYPDYSLEDHWNEGKIKAEIETGKYDYVVIQQGPSALEESKKLLLDYAMRIAELCKKHNAKLAVYMVWPSKARAFDHDRVIKSYTEAAEKTGAVLCPAGLAWKNAWQKDSTIALYSEDGFHPSMAGSVLAGLTIYGAITGKTNLDFIKHSKTTWKQTITKEVLEKLKEAAVQSVSRPAGQLGSLSAGQSVSRTVPQSSNKQRQHFFAQATKNNLAPEWLN